MNYNRIYEYRFEGVDSNSKKVAWEEISSFLFEKMKNPKVVLDPAAGFCEFINSVPSAEKWAIDQNLDFLKIHANENVRQIGGDCLKTELPQEYYDAVFVSNFLEHLQNPEEVFGFFEKAYSWLKKDGILAVMGPNFKFCMKDYFDCSDHRVILTDVSLCELGYSAGFTIDECISKFLPYSFRSRLPVSRFFVKNYRNCSAPPSPAL